MKPSEGPSPDRVAYVLSRVNAGLATQWSEIDELAASLEQMLADAHELGQPYIPAVRREEWDRAWWDLHEVFRSLRSLDAEARERFCAVEASAAPLKSWNHILEHEHEFSDHLAAIRAIGAENVASADHSTWEDLCTAIELRIGTLHATLSPFGFSSNCAKNTASKRLMLWPAKSPNGSRRTRTLPARRNTRRNTAKRRRNSSGSGIPSAAYGTFSALSC